MRRVVINGRSYAVGLQWALLKPSVTREEVIQRAETSSPPCDLIVMLKQQYGMGCSEGQAWKRTCSLAASLVQGIPSDTVYVFTLNDADTAQSFWWVIGIRKGMISAQSDRYFDELAQANALAVSLQESLGVSQLDSFTLDKSISVLSEHLGVLKQKRFGDSAALTPLRETGKIKLLKAAIGAGVLVFFWWAGSAVLEYKATRDAMEQARILTQNKEKRARELAANPERYFSNGWMKAPLPSSFFRQSVPEMFHFPLAANGWRLAGLSCSGNALTAAWEQTPLSDYMYLPFNATLDSKNPKRAFSTRQLPPFPDGQRTLSELLTQEEAQRRLFAFTQRFRLHLKKLSFDKRERNSIERIELVCPWGKGAWEITDVPAFLITDYENLGAALNIPGLIVTELSYQKHWTVRGEFYAK